MKVSVSFWFCAMVCLLGWIDSSACCCFLFAVILHELGHILALKLWRIKIVSVRFFMCGARIDTACLPYGVEVACAAAGPLVGVVIGVVMICRVPLFAMISIGLSIVNMLPLYPLDGGRILRSVLLMMLTHERAEATLHMITVCMCAILMLFACWFAIELQTGVWPIFAAVALLWKAGGAEKQLLFFGTKDRMEGQDYKR